MSKSDTWPEIPDEIVEYAFKVETWFRANNIKAWRVGGVQSYPHAEAHYFESEMSKSLSQLEATQAVASALQRHIADLEQQRDAALRLPQYAIYRDEFASWMIVNESKMFDQCIKDRGGPYIEYDELRAIFAPKEGK